MPSALDLLHEAGTTITAGDNQLKNISALIAEEHEANCAVETAEALLADAKRRRYDLRRNSIPEAMLAAGMSEFKTEDGVKAVLKFDTDGSLGSPKTAEEFRERERKLDIIIENGGDEIVKQMVVIEFPKGAVAEAEVIRERIEKLLGTKKWGAIKGTRVYRQRSVNHMTLMSWIKSKMEADDLLDRIAQSALDRLGIWYGQVAKITRPKEEKSGS